MNKDQNIECSEEGNGESNSGSGESGGRDSSDASPAGDQITTDGPGKHGYCLSWIH